MSLELGDRSGKLTIGDGRRGPSRYNVEAGDTAAVLEDLGRSTALLGKVRNSRCRPSAAVLVDRFPAGQHCQTDS
jgi:hypothetical protein